MTTTPAVAPLSADQLDNLEALARAATPGPWDVESGEVGHDTAPFVHVHKPDANGIPEDGMRIRVEKHHMHPARKPVIGGPAWNALAECALLNAQFVAAANPATILALIAQARTAIAADRAQQAGAAAPSAEVFGLYRAVNEMMACLGAHGEINARDDRVQDVMAALHVLDGGKVAERVEDLVEKAFMPRYQATRLAVSEYCTCNEQTATPQDQGAGMQVASIINIAARIFDFKPHKQTEETKAKYLRFASELARQGQGEPAAYVNGDELDNMLDDRTATIQGTKSGFRATPLYRASPAQASAAPAILSDDERAMVNEAIRSLETGFMPNAAAILRRVVASAAPGQARAAVPAVYRKILAMPDAPSGIGPALAASPEPATAAVPALIMQALTDGIPLQEPVNIGKALRAHRLARVVLSGGTGPVAAVHLVNIGLTGWIYTRETAEAYAKGYNDALKHFRHALLDVAAQPVERPADDARDAQTQAARDVLAERRRQVEQEGWHPDQDDDYEDGQLSMAAACYAMQGNTPNYGPPPDWPWDRKWWKPTTDRRNLVKAGALILADIERIDRAAMQSTTTGATDGAEG